MYTLRSYTRTIIRVLKGYFKCRTVLHNTEPHFEKTGTGSGLALLCDFRVAQARAAKEERHQQESQSHVADLATLSLDQPSF